MKTGPEPPKKLPAGTLPLRNKKRELFCQLYASEYWGRPAEAMRQAKYAVKSGTESGAVKELLAVESIRERVRHLRALRSELSIADQAWIQEELVRIIQKAPRDSDRIRALANLHRIQADAGKTSSRPVATVTQPELPLFEGPGENDGSGMNSV